MKIRYGLLRHIYTHYMMTALYGGTLWRPLIFEFPLDPNSYKFIDTEFLLGSGILIAPVLDKGITSLNVYFPNVNWYDLTGNLIYKKNGTSVSGGNVSVDVSLPDKTIPWFIR